MNLLLWAASYPPEAGGVGVVVQALARSLASRGHEVRVITQSGADRDDESIEHREEGPIHRLPFHQVLSSRDPERVAALTSRIIAIRREFTPTVLHAHAMHPSEFFLLRTQAVAPCPIVFTIHGWTELAGGPDTLRRRLLRESTRVVGVSEHVTRRAIQEDPALGGRALTILNGCDDPGIAIGPLPFDPPVVLYAGRLAHEKGVDRLVAVMPALVSRVPRLRLVIVGDGPERASLERLSEALGVRASVEFAGALERAQVFAWMNRATVVALPSRGGAEGLPLIALEAALLARPVVATRCGGSVEAVVDGETGFLVESEGPRGLERALIEIIETPDHAVRLGAAGRARALGSFGWDAHVSRYCDLYDDVVLERTR